MEIPNITEINARIADEDDAANSLRRANRLRGSHDKRAENKARRRRVGKLLGYTVGTVLAVGGTVGTLKKISDQMETQTRNNIEFIKKRNDRNSSGPFNTGESQDGKILRVTRRSESIE